MRWNPFRSLVVLVAAAAALAGCGKSMVGSLVQPLRPTVEITFSPIQQDSVSYTVRINWSGSDADGQVVGFQYAVDPPASPTPGNDTVWVDTRASEVTLLFPSTQPRRPLPPVQSIVPSSDYHTFVVRAIDNEGLRSAPDSRSFTSFTIAPTTLINVPRPTSQLAISTTPSLTISWTGTDSDGSQRPVKYKYRLVPATQIDPANPGGITAGRIQEFFEADAVNFFATWDSVSGDTTSKFYEGLTPNANYYFAIIAIDEAGAYEPRFNLNSNTLQFRPTLDKLGPRIRVFNEFFSRLQVGSGVSLAENRIVKLEFPADASIVFNWEATPPTGALLTGYRWCVDIADQDITNEDPRTDDNDVNHWSTWSLNETSARIGPFTATPESSATHYFYVEARDNLGFVTLFTIRLTILKPSFAQPLLAVDDLYGGLTQAVDFRNPGGPIRLSGSFPLEAEADSFYYARGGYPDSLYIRSGTPGVTSVPGVFADYAPDTLDYQFYPIEGMDLARLGEYKALVWYTDVSSAARQGSKFSASPATAIRVINSVNRLNTLAVYLRQGGNVWIFGEGTTTAIANGYFSRYGNVPRVPYTSGENPLTNVLFEGNFLYDFAHIRSELNQGGSSTFQATQLKSCIPYLPQFSGPADQNNRLLDPRIDARVGAGARRTALKWDGLPRLTIAPYRGVVADPAVNQTWVIKLANQITSGPPSFTPTMDTLYLHQARQYDPTGIYQPNSADGYPNAVHYYGTDNGPNSQLVWFGFPLHFFERDQVKTVVAKVMQNFGIPTAPPSMRGAHPMRVAPVPRIVDGGDTVDDRIAETRRDRR